MEINIGTKKAIPTHICDLNNQKNGFMYGLKFLEVTNNKVTQFEINQVSPDDNLLVVKIIEAYGDQRMERTYTHTGFAMLFDELYGVVYIFGPKFVTYFRAAFPLELGGRAERKLKSGKA